MWHGAARHVQIIDHSGQNIMNDRVRQGDMFVVPRCYATSMKAGRDDIEWLTFRTTGLPMRSPVAGYTLVFRAMCLSTMQLRWKQEGTILNGWRSGQQARQLGVLLLVTLWFSEQCPFKSSPIHTKSPRAKPKTLNIKGVAKVSLQLGGLKFCNMYK